MKNNPKINCVLVYLLACNRLNYDIFLEKIYVFNRKQRFLLFQFQQTTFLKKFFILFPKLFSNDMFLKLLFSVISFSAYEKMLPQSSALFYLFVSKVESSRSLSKLVNTFIKILSTFFFSFSISSYFCISFPLFFPFQSLFQLRAFLQIDLFFILL